MIRVRWFARLVVALTLCLSSGARAAERPIVILLSWDGTRHDFPERVTAPALARMQRDGARAERLVPVFPSSTFPNHVSLATGTYVDRHGIIGNRFTDRSGRRFDYSNDASWIEAEPIWAAAERQGVRAATFFWVGSESDWRGRGATYRRKPFDASIGEAEKVDQILAWVDLPVEKRPGLIMSWWHGCDRVGHDEGPDSSQIAVELLEQDAQLARLFAGLDERGAWPHTTVIVTSDHGMAEVSALIDVPGPLESHGIASRMELSGGDGQVYLQDPAQAEAALAALTTVDGLEAYSAERLPASYRSFFPGRSGDLTLVAQAPHVLARISWIQQIAAVWRRVRGRGTGAHGYDPERSDMGAIFFALGRGVPKATKLGPVRAIDVAPTAAALLQIDAPAQSEGRALFSPD